MLTSNKSSSKSSYFDPTRYEKTFPSLFLGLMQNAVKSFMLVDKNGSEPMSGREGREGGNL